MIRARSLPSCLRRASRNARDDDQNERWARGEKAAFSVTILEDKLVKAARERREEEEGEASEEKPALVCACLFQKREEDVEEGLLPAHHC